MAADHGTAAGPGLSLLPLLQGIAMRFTDCTLGARETHVDPVLGPLRVPGVTARFSRTPGRVRHLGPALGADTDALLDELGYDAEAQARLRADGVVA